jgi:predicted permease
MNPRWQRYLRFFGVDVQADVDDELAFHMEMRIRDYELHGMTRIEAERAARERFGDVDGVHQQLTHHDQRRERRLNLSDTMDRLGQDFRLALRGFRRTPGFFVTAVVILGLGIGMSVAMFTVFRAVLVKRLPVVDQDRIAVMWTYRTPGVEFAGGTKELAVVRKESKTMRDIAAVAHYPASPSPFVDGTRSIAMNRAMVTGNFFGVLGARPVLGRLFTPQDDDVGEYEASGANASKVLVLSYKAWQRRFGGDASVIGRKLIEPFSRWTYTVVGVAPPGLDYPEGAEYWIPIWGGWNGQLSSFAVARLNAGATVTAARDEYVAIENRLAPEWHIRGADAKTFGETVLGNVTPVLTTLSAAVALLLLIGCLNVGNLLLLRASGRAREIAVRRALGASFGDIARQLLVESVTLAAVGGLLGLGIAIVLLRALIAFSPPHIPRLDDVSVSGAPMIIAIIVSSASVLLFGVVPALFAARTNLATPLRMDARSGSDTKRRRALRQLLVASQVALAMIMLGGAALLARSLARLEGQNAGYVAEHVSYLEFSWNTAAFDSTDKILALGKRLERAIRAVPGVTAASTTNIPPLLGLNNWQARFDKPGQAESDAASNPVTPWEAVGPDFFRALGIPVTRGRAFTDADRMTNSLVMIVSQSTARRYWPNEDPIGKQLGFSVPGLKALPPWMGARTVVGVVPDTHLRSFRQSAPAIYLPTQQSTWQGHIVLRSARDLKSLLPALRTAGRDVDPDLSLWKADTMNELLTEPLAQPRLGTLLMSSFGIVALLLAAIGLYGVMAALVRDQTREIGIRIALGASAAHVRREVLGRAAFVTGVGVAAGFAGALATSHLLTALLFEVSPTDPIALSTACGTLLLVGALAAYLPARRATRIDPVQALRAD